MSADEERQPAPPRRTVPPRDRRRNELLRAKAASLPGGLDNPAVEEILDQCASRETEIANDEVGS